MAFLDLFNSSTSSTSNTFATTTNNSLQGIDGHATIVTGSNNQVTDFGAVEAALDTTKFIYDETIDMLQTTQARSMAYNQNATENALDFAMNISKPSTERTTEDIIKYTGLAILGVIISTAITNVIKN